MPKKYDYDVIIIGAGISGLVCGCYLAKAGLKTLIVDKNVQPGGYCTSFTRNGFRFNACAHGLGSLRTGGRLNKVLQDLDILKRLKLNRLNPSDIVLTPKYKIRIFGSLEETIKEFQSCFPTEVNSINQFIRFVAYSDTFEFLKLRSITLEDLLNKYFKNSELKTILSFFILGLVGLPPREVSAIVASLIFREFVFDGGYYPLGGVQDLPDILLKRFKELGGEAVLSNAVIKANLRGSNIGSVVLKGGANLTSKKFVLACDLRHFLLDIIGEEFIPSSVTKKIKSTPHSTSAFLVYLGINDNLEHNKSLNSHVWILNNHNIKEVYSNILSHKNDCLLINKHVNKVESNNNNFRTSLRLESSTTYENQDFWNAKNRTKMTKIFKKMCSQVIPNIEDIISLEFNACPQTLTNWTSNYCGASYGWASTIKQFGDPDFSQKTYLNNVYLTGHWSNQSSGIAFVANCGFDTANLLIKRESKS